jgi:hypothetical protein
MSDPLFVFLWHSISTDDLIIPTTYLFVWLENNIINSYKNDIYECEVMQDPLAFCLPLAQGQHSSSFDGIIIQKIVWSFCFLQLELNFQ